MRKPLISIIIPSFNQGIFLRQTLLSVIKQDYPNKEIIVIDGNSNDNSVDIIREFSDSIFYWISEKDKGQSDAINKGILKANGEIITWLNSDDYYLPGTLSRVADIWIEKRFDLLVGNCVFVNEAGEEIARNPKSKLLSGDQYFPFNRNCIINQPSSFFSRNAVNITGPLDISLHYTMDVDFWMKLAARGGKFIYVDEDFTYFRRHENTKSANGNIAFIEDIESSGFFSENLKKENIHYYKKCKKNWVDEYLRQLRMEHFTRKFSEKSKIYFWQYPFLVIRHILKYKSDQLKLLFRYKIFRKFYS